MLLQRLGRLTDGGYVLDVETIVTVETCFTYGVGLDTSFELELLSINPTVIIYLHDPIDFNHVLPERMFYYKERLSNKKHTGLLKIDVEGDEYEFFNSNPDLSEVSCLIVEFHFVDTQRDLFLQTVAKLNLSFDTIHVHGNNYGRLVNGLPTVLEITFKRKPTIQYPLPIDFPNNFYKPDLSFRWPPI